jgi:hypothetical protein
MSALECNLVNFANSHVWTNSYYILKQMHKLSNSYKKDSDNK